MNATTLDPMASALPGSLLSWQEKWHLGSRLTLALACAVLLAIATGLRFGGPGAAALADLVAGMAAAVIAIPVAIEAWRALRAPTLHAVTDLLVAAALLGAWALGDLATAALVPLAMVIGHVLEERSLLGTRDAIAALGRLGEGVVRRIGADGTMKEIASGTLSPGDRLEIRPGERLTADVLIEEGQSSVDPSALTGESIPIDVGPGEAISAGAVNGQGRLIVTVLRIGAESAFGRVIALVKEAEQAKPPVTRFLERFAMPYLALVLMAAVAALMLGGGLGMALTVLVASCPCALVLAAPATAVAAISVAARHGILVKGTAFLEELGDVDTLVVDKTGTLTLGDLRVTAVHPLVADDHAQLLAIAATLGAASTHPVSRAMARLDVTRCAVSDVQERGGLGVIAIIDGAPALLGRPALLREQGIIVTEPVESTAHDGPIVAVAHAGRCLGFILLADIVRTEAAGALADLSRCGLQRHILLTGDRRPVAERIAASLAVTEVQAEVTPEAKLACVRDLVHAGRRPLVVGDGINDVLALKAGTVGVAMGAAGTDAALASADLVLTSSDLRRLGTALRLSRACRRVIAQNIAIGLSWTAVVVLLATLGGLGPVGAVLLHHLGTAAVVFNAGRLLGFDEPLGA